MDTMTEAEAIGHLLRAGIEMPDPALVARLVAASGPMRGSLARQPRDLPAGLEPAAAFAVPAR
ncbi:hypothetical protein [Siccirubricoccus phaeus]|uniref:hypothetical protein n=1 Tax=Siccirubricoccus phaeus TaxID=2595053 RepID=UPI0011F1B48C|nr:hypothetical protein [Siccirubricoccus phaeus]